MDIIKKSILEQVKEKKVVTVKELITICKGITGTNGNVHIMYPILHNDMKSVGINSNNETLWSIKENNES